MTPLGKPLVFYLKYMAEMNRLYGDPEYFGGEPDLTGLDNPAQVKEMARIVGDFASEQAADFLELCARRIEEHFTNLGNATLSSKKNRRYMTDYWQWMAKVVVSSVGNGWFECGVLVTAPPDVRISLAKDVCGVAVPWLSSRGGRKAADAIWNILGGCADSRAGEGLVEGSGEVALARIPIKAQPPDSLDVDRDQIITEVISTFARIDAEQTRALASNAARLKEPDES
jgi:hypothetical protein